MAQSETIVLSLGGSIIVPNKPDPIFLKQFKDFIEKNIESYRFVIVCGGGKTCTYYNNALKQICEVDELTLDRLGIMTTKLNAVLVKSMFGDLCYSSVVSDPCLEFETGKNIIICSGWKPGNSTDYIAVKLAEKFDVKRIFNLSNIDYVYDKDPNKHRNAKKINTIKWHEYRKLISSEWIPRLNTPFDPIASKQAEKLNLEVVIVNGTKLQNLENCINNKQFQGTIIRS